MRSPVARGIVWTFGLLVCAVSMWVSFQLTLLHYKPSAAPFIAQICTSLPGSNCEKVAHSRWSILPPLPAGLEKTEAASKPASAASKQAGQSHGVEDMDVSTGSDHKLYFGVPTAELGLAFFGAILCWLLFTGPAPATRFPLHLLFLLATLAGLAASLFFEVIMWTQLDVWCPLCVAAHTGSLLLVVVAFLLWPRRTAVDLETPAAADLLDSASTAMAPRSDRRGAAELCPSSVAVVAALITAVLLAMFEHYYFMTQFNKNKAEAAESKEKLVETYYTKKFKRYDDYWQHNLLAWQLTPVVNIPVEDRPVRGEPDAPHTIVIFSDFECPACAKFEVYLNKTILPMGRNSGHPAFRLIFKYWPICTDCNKVMKGNSLHPAACEAAYAAEAARVLGGNQAFWKMHDLLFENQERWKHSRDFMPYARKIGLDEAAFRKAMASPQVIDRVKADIADGDSIGKQVPEKKRDEIVVTGTPAIFVDGKRLETVIHGKTWSALAAGVKFGLARPPAKAATPGSAHPAGVLEETQ